MIFRTTNKQNDMNFTKNAVITAIESDNNGAFNATIENQDGEPMFGDEILKHEGRSLKLIDKISDTQFKLKPLSHDTNVYDFIRKKVSVYTNSTGANYPYPHGSYLPTDKND